MIRRVGHGCLLRPYVAATSRGSVKNESSRVSVASQSIWRAEAKRSIVTRLVDQADKARVGLEVMNRVANTVKKHGWDIGDSVEGGLGAIDCVGDDMRLLSASLQSRVQNRHPLLDRVASYYFSLNSKRFRPLLALLIARATSGSVSPKQLHLAEIVEMIHTATLMHDDVIDNALVRRSQPSANALYGHKHAILAGDYLLATASLLLSDLENFQCSRLVSQALSDLVEGEFMQLGREDFDVGAEKMEEVWGKYLKKTYLKTASLIANACKAAAVLSECREEEVEFAREYGKCIGIAFQIIDDTLDVVNTQEEMGKGVQVDLKLGLTTAPVLFAMEEQPRLRKLASRKFSKENDAAEAREMVMASSGVKKSNQLATEYSIRAVQAAEKMQPSEAREGLIALAGHVITRRR